MKKLMRLILICALVLLLSVPAFADVAPPFGGGSGPLGLSTPVMILLLIAVVAGLTLAERAIMKRLNERRAFREEQMPDLGSAAQEDKNDPDKK